MKQFILMEDKKKNKKSNPIEKININNEEICLKKGWDGHRVVYPWKKDLSKPYSWANMNWKNFLIGGHWSRPLKMFLFLVVLYLFAQMYLSDTATCREYVSNFSSYCPCYSQNVTITQKESPDNPLNPLVTNFTNFTIFTIKNEKTPS